MQSLRVTVTLTMPATIPAGARNCSRVRHPPGYVDPVPGNDEACVGLPPSGPQPPPPPPRTEKCNATVRAGGDAPETIDIDLAGFQGTATFSWNTYTQKDRMNVSAGGQVIHDTGCVGSAGTKDFPAAGIASVRVEVQPNCEPGAGTGTVWDFKVECPGQQDRNRRRSTPPAGLPDFGMKKSQTTPPARPALRARSRFSSSTMVRGRGQTGRSSRIRCLRERPSSPPRRRGPVPNPAPKSAASIRPTWSCSPAFR